MEPGDLDVTQPFTRTQALKAGIKDHQLRSSTYRQLLTGVYVASSTAATDRQRVAAALLAHPEAHASHASAARILGLPIPTLPDEHVTVVDRRKRRTRAGVVCHSASRCQVVTVDGLRVSSLLQVFVELATLLGLVDLVVVGDHLLRRRKVTLAVLRQFCEESGSPGAGAALRALRFLRERVDSPMESRLRMLIVLTGLPEPEVNWSVRDEIGDPIRRYDLCWRSSKIAVEYDGRQHVEVQEQWEADVERRGQIEDDEWRLITVISSGIYRRPDLTLARIHQALLVRGEPGVPAVLSDAWRPHFPVIP